MLAARGVLTSFRSVSTLIGLEVAGTSGAQGLRQESSAAAAYWSRFLQETLICSKRVSALHAPAKAPNQPQNSSLHLLTSVRRFAALHSRSAVSSVVKSHGTQAKCWSLAAGQQRSFRTHSTARSLWQRDYYQSGYNRGFGNHWDGDKVLYGLIAANVAGFFLWQSHPGLMRQQAVVSVNSVREGRIHTLLTSAFSHASLSHLFANMFTFYFFGRDIGMTFGGKKLLGLYVAGGIAGSLAHVIYFYILAQATRAGPFFKEVRMANSPPALGASAAVNAIVMLSILLYPRRMVYLYAVLPVPAAVLGVIYIGGDMLGLLGEGGGNIAYAGHLGGAALGAAYYLALRRGRIRW